MKKYLIAAALILCAPQAVLAQAEVFYLMVDNTTKQCRIMPGSELTSTNKARYKELGKYATMDDAKAALELHDRKCLPEIISSCCLGRRHVGSGYVTRAASSGGRHDYANPERVGYELMVSAWPEPPSAMSAESTAGVRDGVEALAFGITETRTTSRTK